MSEKKSPSRKRVHDGARSKSKKRKTGISRAAAASGPKRKSGEVKTVDVPSTLTTPSTTVTTNLINGITEGVDANNRVGRRINLKSIQLRMAWGNIAPTAATDPYIVRYALIYDRQPNAAAPAWADVFSDIDVAGAITSGPLAHTNPTNFDRFVVVRDGLKVFKSPPAGTLGIAEQENGNRQDSAERWFVKLQDLESHYISGAGAGTIADIRTGSLYFMTLGSNTAANAAVTITWTARLRFFDM